MSVKFILQRLTVICELCSCFPRNVFGKESFDEIERLRSLCVVETESVLFWAIFDGIKSNVANRGGFKLLVGPRSPDWAWIEGRMN
jgi:hypothetical protein